jgi:serine protease Do
MENNEFNFYNNENDGYRGGFGEYMDPVPVTPGPEAPQNQKKPGKGFSKKIVALVLACAIVGGGAGVGGAALYQNMSRGGTVVYEGERPKVQTVVNNNNGEPMTPEQLYAANLASCVGITVNTTVNIYGQTTTSAATGSGFVLTQDGYIVTNYHVIEDATKDSSVTIEVSFSDGSKYTAKLVGGEQDNDIAVLKIDATGLQPVTLGDSSQLVVGESVYAIGNPLGELTYTLTDGIVSALDRLITTSSQDANGNTVSTTLNVLQTNCAINPGNSGGPLFDSYGNVVGVVSAKMTESSSGVSAEGLGFAIPINDVKDIINDLIEHGYVTGKPYMGVQVQSVPDYVQNYGVSAGAYVVSVAEGSCAEKAGLQQGDIIIAIDDTAIDTSSALTAALSSNYKAGDTATLTIIRNNEKMTLSITFDEKNEQTEAANQSQESNQQQQQQQQQSGGSYGWPFSGYSW